KYFYFLRRLKSIRPWQISVTLRLYPFAYPKHMGMPPADRATLMCYNLLSPKEAGMRNAVLDQPTLEQYLKIAQPVNYPLHLDLALPLFSWMHVHRDGRFLGMFPALP